MIGRELGQYRIEDELGAGGMGVVYRALDSRNRREVALKTLSGAALADAERRARFQREAQLASSLHHPNIIAVYEIGSAVQDGRPIDFMAMELVEGTTLERIVQNSGPLGEVKALHYGIQIGSALAAAHGAGIVHRDLKPSNVMIAAAGDTVKIVDFGLAKMAGPLQHATAYGATQSVKVGLTVDGTIMGSVAYMSPEQAEGKPIDARTDIFSFGSVLYEMLSGKQAFPGDTQVGSLSAVLLKDPPPLSAAQASDGLRTIVQKCLRKDPTKRWQSMADVRLSLEEVRDAVPKPETHAPTRRGLLLAAAGAGLLAGLAPAAYFATKRQPKITFERLTFRRGDIWKALFGPKGEIYYSARWDGSSLETYLSMAGSRDARSVGLPTGKTLSINAASEALIILGENETGTLARAGMSGGAPKELLEDVSDACWGPDGSSIAVVRSVEGKHRLEYPIGKVLYESGSRPPAHVQNASASCQSTYVTGWSSSPRGMRPSSQWPGAG